MCPITHDVVSVVCGAIAIGTAILGIDGGDQHVVAVVHKQNGMTVGITNRRSIADRVVGVNGGMPFRIRLSEHPVVVVVGEGGHAATCIGARQQVTEMVVAAVGVESLRIQCTHILTKCVIEILRHLLLGRRQEVRGIEENYALCQVAEGIVLITRQIAPGAAHLDQVLPTVVAVDGGVQREQGCAISRTKSCDAPRIAQLRAFVLVENFIRGDECITHGRCLARNLVEGGVGKGSDIAGVIGLLRQVAPRVIFETRGVTCKK